MTESICAKCGARAESHWRVRLERESANTDETATYRLCRGCWNDLQARHTESGSKT